MGVCNCSMFCCTLLYVHSSTAIILMEKTELIALLNLSSWCLVMVERLFLALPRGCLQFVIVVFPDHTHLLFLTIMGGMVSSGICGGRVILVLRWWVSHLLMEMFLTPLPVSCVFLGLFVLQGCVLVLMTSTVEACF